MARKINALLTIIIIIRIHVAVVARNHLIVVVSKVVVRVIPNTRIMVCNDPRRMGRFEGGPVGKVRVVAKITS
jgi:hypothetical protein